MSKQSTARRQKRPLRIKVWICGVCLLIIVLGLYISEALEEKAFEISPVGPLAPFSSGSPVPSSFGPLPYSEIELPEYVTEDLLPLNEHSRPGTPLDEINGIVVHYVGNPGTTAEQNRSYFGNLAQSGEAYASSHFIIGMDGTVICAVPLDEVAYCSNSRNSDTISIECCHPDESGRFTQETYDALLNLTSWLCRLYALEREDIIRHYDVTGKVCPKYFVDHPDEWDDFRNAVSLD